MPRILLTMALTYLTPTLLVGQETTCQELDVVAYNAHLLPKVANKVAGKRSQSEYRAEAIAKRLAEHDILGISEAFDKECARLLIERLQRQSEHAFTIIRGPSRTGRHLIGSGLLMASRYPVEETHTITYSHASRFVTSGFKADGFAAKGALHVRFRIADRPHALVDCFLTHLESRSSEARNRQIERFAEFVVQHSDKDVPMILMGDFNVNADPSLTAANPPANSQYQQLVKALELSDRALVDAGRTVSAGPLGTSDAVAKDGGRRIDYVFLSQGLLIDSPRLRLLQTENLPLLDERVTEGSLSDHLAVRCRLLADWEKRRDQVPQTAAQSRKEGPGANAGAK